jgi:hypothetical protein
VERDDFDRALNEEIDTLLTQAEPSAQFRARVLQQIGAEPESVRRRVWLTLIPAAAAVALLMVGALAWLRVPPGDGPVVPEGPAAAPIATAPLSTAVPSQPINVPDRRTSPREVSTPSGTSEVLISPDDAVAFDAFISSVESGRLWADMFAPSNESLPGVIEPLRLEPLATIPPLEEAEL